MKKIEAIIKPFKLEEVREALLGLGIDRMTVSDVRKFGHQTAHTEIYRATESTVEFMRETKLEVVLPDSLLAQAAAAISKAANTKLTGNGRLLVSPVEEFA